MRQDVQKIFKKTPHEKQVMMFTATLNDVIRPVCLRFMREVITTQPNQLYISAMFTIYFSK